MKGTNTIPEWSLADRLRKALDASGVSGGEMAEALMVNRNTIGNYLSGRTIPKPAYLRLWAEKCDVPLEWLTGGALDLRNPPSRCTELLLSA